MPLYSYLCLECESIFEVRHSYKDKFTNCTGCSSEKIQKYLAAPLKKIDKNTSNKSTAGDLVDQTIEETKYEIKKDKKQLSQRTYKARK